MFVRKPWWTSVSDPDNTSRWPRNSLDVTLSGQGHSPPRISSVPQRFSFPYCTARSREEPVLLFVRGKRVGVIRKGEGHAAPAGENTVDLHHRKQRLQRTVFHDGEIDRPIPVRLHEDPGPGSRMEEGSGRMGRHHGVPSRFVQGGLPFRKRGAWPAPCLTSPGPPGSP